MALGDNFNIRNFLKRATPANLPQIVTAIFNDLVALAASINNSGGVLNNFNATRIPAVTDDSSQGYSIGSQWIYAKTIYQCVDATNGAAVWNQISVV